MNAGATASQILLPIYPEMSVQNITCQHVRVLAMKCGKLKSGKLNGKVLIIPTLVLVWQEKTAYTLQYRASTQQ